ncbi:membrane protease YdiL (CAAX protease family) [Dysgonomonas sp. PH5-45]|uniref:CPBP family intramembrane glutamic endopeptidase n=1 Tax=unclassified Dysgonomonas TaxID=2630389 RepID=UPI0024752BA0|nr:MULTISPECIES: CPBP family intramembrane glutamic endopeptidase [unclassified Dysgonomonas]MDH6355660.1 membrane protease YdiL (CAAX protease family) [Dysgonomonas sp. PH5-45]MDH6388557.1 membrane protease YdiL (CAAX protease family) [Dysgonomonas sp. PH5-37]
MMNSLKKIYVGMSGWMQLLFIIIFSFVGIMILSFALILVFLVTGMQSQGLEVLTASADFIRINLSLQSPLLFLLPACLWAYFFNEKGIEALKINKTPDLRFLLLGLALIIVIQPIISFTGYYNDQLVLPESLSWLEEKMRASEDRAAALFDTLLAGKTITDLVLNLLLVAVMAGICEEFLFRGAIQQIFGKITRNPHLAVWITAIIFSAIHMQFYGFVPRVILGAALGYLFVWSGNLWIPIIIHTVNNAFSVIACWAESPDENYSKSIEQIGVGDTWWMTLVSALLTGIVVFYLVKIYNKRRIIEGEI